MRYKARTDDVAWRVVEGEAVLVHAESSAYYGLNRTGTAVWEALAKAPRSVDELANGLAKKLDAPVLQTRQDLDAFLVNLVGAGLAAPEQEGAEMASGQGASLDPPVAGPYEPPQLSPFGELEQLILSGE